MQHLHIFKLKCNRAPVNSCGMASKNTERSELDIEVHDLLKLNHLLVRAKIALWKVPSITREKQDGNRDR